mmetsp:Transcript_72155/g.165532  ORF Transcript_72155/g.165532 Transcript_72155/m.165532 type:complete len:208 (-) Transcript_72155:1245-1868(-)
MPTAGSPAQFPSSMALSGVENLEDSEKANLQDKGVHQQHDNTLGRVHVFDTKPLQDGATDQAPVLSAELIVHEPLEGVGVEGQMVPPLPSRRDILLRHHEPLAQHKHPKHPRAQGHPDDVVRLRCTNQMHQRLRHDQRQQQVQEEIPESIQVRKLHDEDGGDQRNQRNTREARQEVGHHVREADYVAVGPLAAEHIALLQEEREHCH